MFNRKDNHNNSIGSFSVTLAELALSLKNISTKLDSQALETESLKRALFVDENSISSKISALSSQISEVARDNQINFDRLTLLERDLKDGFKKLQTTDEHAEQRIDNLERTQSKLQDKAKDRERIQQIIITALAAVLVPISVNYFLKLISDESPDFGATTNPATEVQAGYPDKKSLRAAAQRTTHSKSY